MSGTVRRASRRRERGASTRLVRAPHRVDDRVHVVAKRTGFRPASTRTRLQSDSSLVLKARPHLGGVSVDRRGRLQRTQHKARARAGFARFPRRGAIP